jgi:pyrroline-5-carboxylate reductase
MPEDVTEDLRKLGIKVCLRIEDMRIRFVPPDQAIVSTVAGLTLAALERGAVEMGLARPDQGLSALWDSLAAPNGITRHGLKTLEESGSFEAWVEAMEKVLERLGDGSQK